MVGYRKGSYNIYVDVVEFARGYWYVLQGCFSVFVDFTLLALYAVLDPLFDVCCHFVPYKLLLQQLDC